METKERLEQIGQALDQIADTDGAEALIDHLYNKQFTIILRDARLDKNPHVSSQKISLLNLAFKAILHPERLASQASTTPQRYVEHATRIVLRDLLGREPTSTEISTALSGLFEPTVIPQDVQ